MARGLETLAVVRPLLPRQSDRPPADVHVVATSAIRDAANGERFLADAQAQSGLEIEVLSAREEAYFGYVAAVNTTHAAPTASCSTSAAAAFS